ncbi:MAG: metallophosphatase family protein [Chloroflexota bacterium]|nr:metallophosphatase family protein [Chloroflexota bacterium]
MARWGLISDVHGNLVALDEALSVLAAAGAQRLAFLGDYLGRGDPDGCVRRIREVADAVVVGNRDLDWQLRVSAESRAWVLGLPRTALVDSLLLAHGDARLTRGLGTSQVARHFADAWRHLEQAGATVFAFGHSHHARTWRKASYEADAERVGDFVAVEPPYRYFLNVGTTGLPFPGKGGPSVALVDATQLRHVPLSWPTRG